MCERNGPSAERRRDKQHMTACSNLCKAHHPQCQHPPHTVIYKHKAHIHIYISTPTYIQTYVHTYMHTYRQSHTCSQVYTHVPAQNLHLVLHLATAANLLVPIKHYIPHTEACLSTYDFNKHFIKFNHAEDNAMFILGTRMLAAWHIG